MKVYVDVDHTICRTPHPAQGHGYADAVPISENIDMVNELYDEGHRITYYTARGSVSGIDWRELTEKQLKEWGCRYHDLKLGKPDFDVLIDDKAMNSRIWEQRGNAVIRQLNAEGPNFQGDKFQRMEVRSGGTECLYDHNSHPGEWATTAADCTADVVRGIKMTATSKHKIEMVDLPPNFSTMVSPPSAPSQHITTVGTAGVVGSYHLLPIVSDQVPSFAPIVSDWSHLPPSITIDANEHPTTISVEFVEADTNQYPV